ncbi:MAG TPA: hypothetical protein VFH26_10500, partial [Gemmatimonadales bacterium]|nr:hypothetical protein [Gemmatimonadales bacterium]
AVVVWFAILLLASVNGAIRSTWLIPQLGEPVARLVSTLILCGLVFIVTWLTIGWIRPITTSDTLKSGAVWLVLTLAFEFLAGHYLFRTPWAELLEDYDVARGRIWVLALLFVLLAPWLAARLKGLLG